MNFYFKILIPILSILMISCSDDNNGATNNDQSRSTKEAIHSHIEKRNVQFHALKNNELIVTTDLDEKGDFKHYYLIQSDKKIDFGKSKNEVYEIEFKDTYLIFRGEKGNLIFSIDDENIDRFKSKNDSYFSVFGISKRYSGEKALNINSPTLRMGGVECHSGGDGASECSAESGAPLSGNCSVKCRNTHYACCDDTRNECICVKNGQQPNDESLTPPN